MEDYNYINSTIDHPIEKIAFKKNADDELVFYTAREILDKGPIEVSKLWDPFFKSIGIAALVGSSDCGKSILMKQLALHIVSKKDEFLGYKLNWKNSKVIYVCTEDNYEDVSDYLHKQKIDKSSDIDNLKFLFYRNENLLKCMNRELSENKVDLIIIDGWADTMQGNLNLVFEVRKELNKLYQIANDHKCCIVILHHTNKNSETSDPNKNSVSGSHAIEAKVRSVLELRNWENGKVLSVLKGNSISSEMKKTSLKLTLDEVHLCFTTEGELIDCRKISCTKDNKSKFSSEIEVEFLKLYEGEEELSLIECKQRLAQIFPEEKMPGKTKLSEWAKETARYKSRQKSRKNGFADNMDDSDQPIVL